MKRYDRRALVLDTADSVLGAASLALISQGLDPLYAADPDEAVLLAAEHREWIAALVAPGALSLEQIDLALERLTPRLAIPRESVLIVGPPRVRSHLGGLRERGIRWVVFEPYDASELRFAVAAALACGDALEPRGGLRVPIRLPVAVRSATSVREGEIRNLSMGGAYVALEDPPEPGTELGLEFPIGERLFRTAARVAHCQRDGGSPRAESVAGMGVAFAPVAALDARLLEGFVRERVDCFRL